MFRKREGVVALTGINKNKYMIGKHFRIQKKGMEKRKTTRDNARGGL